MTKSGVLRGRLAAMLLLLCLLTAAAGLAAETETADVSVLGLTVAEIGFLNEHPVVNLGVDPEFIPYEFFDTDGEYKGIAADYLDLISRKTGLRFEIARGLTWSQAYEYAVERRLDALPCVSKTAQREKYFLFSDPYISFQRVIFLNQDNKEINSFEDLYGLTVAVQRNSSHHSYLTAFDQIALSLYSTVEDALLAVADGMEMAFVGNLATSNYLAKTNGITNLKYLPIQSQEPQSLYFAVRSDWPELVGILNKALAAISEESKLSISNRWISVELNADYSWLVRLLLIAAGIVALIGLVSAFWIIRLRREVAIRKKSEAEMEQAKREADEANQFKSSFLARMSHEIRTPLNGIMGMAYLLRKTDVTVTQRMYVDRITQSSGIMLGIINDILDFSKIEAGKVALEVAPFSMDRVIQDVVGIVSLKIEEQKIGLKLTKDPLAPNWLEGDSKRLEQVLINILNNAAKFTGEGEVSLDIRQEAREGGVCHLAFTVADTGIGMSKEQVDQLFTPFVQGDTSINRRFGGTGLGLSIVKNLVDLMGGRIEVFSEQGKGSTFIIHVPLAVDREKEDGYRQLVTGGHFRDVRTLALEKTGAEMNLIQTYLESFGMRCEPAATQLAALSMLQAANGRRAKPFDLLIVDYETPSDGGFQFVKSILDNPRIAKKPKILMLLPMMREDLFDQLDEHGVDAGVGKPIIQSVLLNAIQDIFHIRAIAASRLSEESDAGDTRIEGDFRVLVADDNKTNQLIAKTLLEQVGLTVLLADNGKSASDLYAQNRDTIDLILMDLHMPVMNGYEASDEIRKLSAAVPIVAMTADVISGVKEQCEAHGIRHYLTKPFDPDHFIQTVRGILTAAPGETAKESVLDAAAGMRNLGMSREVYLQILEQYRAENLDTAENLGRAVAQRRYAEAAGIVHKLKSSSGSIGAKPLYDLAVELQAALKEENGGEIEPLIRAFIGMLNGLLDEIRAMTDTRPE